MKTIEVLHDGTYVISKRLSNGDLFKMKYQGYIKREAVHKFSIDYIKADLKLQKLTDNNIIESTLQMITEQTGLNLELCDYFTGMSKSNGKSYFNVILSERLSNSKEFILLQSFANKTKLIRVEQNGVSRVAIFPKNQNK